MEVAFYCCTRALPLAVLPKLAEKAVGAGYPVLVNVAEAGQAGEADEALWTYSADSFLPHGVAGGAQDADQPILISEAFDNPNGARLAMSLSGRLPPPEAGYERVLYLFDANDEMALTRARRQWTAIRQRDGVNAIYWKQTERGWEKQG